MTADDKYEELRFDIIHLSSPSGRTRCTMFLHIMRRHNGFLATRDAATAELRGGDIGGVVWPHGDALGRSPFASGPRKWAPLLTAS